MKRDGDIVSLRPKVKRAWAVACFVLMAAISLGLSQSAAAGDDKPGQAQSSQTPAPQSPASAPALAPQLQPPVAGGQLYASFQLHEALGTAGYFEVTPAGSLILYPAYTSIPSVMQTILAMMGPLSLVGRRGFYQVTPGEKVTFFLPPHSMPGMFAGSAQPPLQPPPFGPGGGMR